MIQAEERQTREPSSFYYGYDHGWEVTSVHLWPFMTEEGPKQRMERLYDRCCHGRRK